MLFNQPYGDRGSYRSVSEMGVRWVPVNQTECCGCGPLGWNPRVGPDYGRGGTLEGIKGGSWVGEGPGPMGRN